LSEYRHAFTPRPDSLPVCADRPSGEGQGMIKIHIFGKAGAWLQDFPFIATMKKITGLFKYYCLYNARSFMEKK